MCYTLSTKHKEKTSRIQLPRSSKEGSRSVWKAYENSSNNASIKTFSPSVPNTLVSLGEARLMWAQKYDESRLIKTGDFPVQTLCKKPCLYDVGVTLNSPRLKVGLMVRMENSLADVQNLTKSSNRHSRATTKADTLVSCTNLSRLSSVFVLTIHD